MGTASSSELRQRLPRLHLITDGETLRRPAFARRAAELLREGGPTVALHLRGRDVPARTLVETAEALLPVAAGTGSLLLVNDRVDVVLACAAQGVQLGGRGMPIAAARGLLGPGALVGASVHSAEEGRRARAEGADFLLAGTLFRTPSHPGRPGAGTAWLRPLAARGVPVVGIGGITPERVEEVVAAGAFGVAVLRGVWDAERPIESLRAYQRALEKGRGMNESIQVAVNGEPREIPAGLSVEGLLEHLRLQPKMVVVEHNGDILRKDRYPETGVAAGDSLELVHFVGGG